MTEEVIQAMNEMIAKQIMAEIPGLVLSYDNGEGWEWKYKEDESDTWLNSPLDAFINFTQVCVQLDLSEGNALNL